MANNSGGTQVLELDKDNPDYIPDVINPPAIPPIPASKQPAKIDVPANAFDNPYVPIGGYPLGQYMVEPNGDPTKNILPLIRGGRTFQIRDITVNTKVKVPTPKVHMENGKPVLTIEGGGAVIEATR